MLWQEGEAVAVMQVLHGIWLPRIKTESVGSLGRCPFGAVRPDREVLQRTTFVREKQYLTFVKVELKVVGGRPGEHMHAENKVTEEQRAKLRIWIKKKEEEVLRM